MKSSTRSVIEQVNARLSAIISSLPGSPAAFIVAVVAFAGIGTVLITGSRAATPTASLEPENATITSPAAASNDLTASSGKALLFSSVQASFGWPDATNTGYKAAPDYPGSLSSCGSNITSNTTYRFCNFSNGLYLGSASNHPVNVTFYGCRFASNAIDDANVANYGDNITFDYSTFEPSAQSAPPTPYNEGYQYGIDLRYAGKMTVDHSDFWGWGNGIQFGSSTAAKPVVVKNSWFHHARDDGGVDHTDAILSNEGGPSYMVFDHNTIASVGNTQGLALQTESRGYDHVTITNNYFSGFGYTVAIGENLPSTNITFTGNTFGTDYQPVFGVMYSDAVWNYSTTGNLWRNNKWRVVPGSYYTPVTDDGKFWLPSGSKSNTDYSG